jgi:hypothetical protein
MLPFTNPKPITDPAHTTEATYSFLLKLPVPAHAQANAREVRVHYYRYSSTGLTGRSYEPRGVSGLLRLQLPEPQPQPDTKARDGATDAYWSGASDTPVRYYAENLRLCLLEGGKTEQDPGHLNQLCVYKTHKSALGGGYVYWKADFTGACDLTIRAVNESLP